MRVLAAIDGSARSPVVLGAAARVAKVLGADLEALHVGEDDQGRACACDAAAAERIPLHVTEGRVAERLAEWATMADVAALAVGVRHDVADLPDEPHGDVLRELMTSLPAPLLIVPERASAVPEIACVMVAVESGPHAVAAVQAAGGAIAARGVRVVAVHVLDAESAPPFVDQPHHFASAFAEELRARAAPGAEIDIALRAGEPPGRLLDAAQELGADLVVLAWNQDLGPGRAAVVRRLVAGGDIPVLLVPATPPDGLA